VPICVRNALSPKGLGGLHPAPFLSRRTGLVETRRHFYPEGLGWLRPGAIFIPKAGLVETRTARFTPKGRAG
jgi:hypothetical protein